jgi:hypothetical protein
MNNPMPKRIKRITSHAGHARYLAFLEETNLTIPRLAAVPSPYSFGPTHLVYKDEQGRNVFISETAHKQYDVFLVPEWAPLTPEVVEA